MHTAAGGNGGAQASSFPAGKGTGEEEPFPRPSPRPAPGCWHVHGHPAPGSAAAVPTSLREAILGGPHGAARPPGTGTGGGAPASTGFHQPSLQQLPDGASRGHHRGCRSPRPVAAHRAACVAWREIIPPGFAGRAQIKSGVLGTAAAAGAEGSVRGGGCKPLLSPALAAPPSPASPAMCRPQGGPRPTRTPRATRGKGGDAGLTAPEPRWAEPGVALPRAARGGPPPAPSPVPPPAAAFIHN